MAGGRRRTPIRVAPAAPAASAGRAGPLAAPTTRGRGRGARSPRAGTACRAEAGGSRGAGRDHQVVVGLAVCWPALTRAVEDGRGELSSRSSRSVFASHCSRGVVSKGPDHAPTTVSRLSMNSGPGRRVARVLRDPRGRRARGCGTGGRRGRAAAQGGGFALPRSPAGPHNSSAHGIRDTARARETHTSIYFAQISPPAPSGFWRPGPTGVLVTTLKRQKAATTSVSTPVRRPRASSARPPRARRSRRS